MGNWFLLTSTTLPSSRFELIKSFHTAELFFIRLVGTRGSLLLIVGTIWSTIGFGFLINPIERFSRPGSGGVLDFLDKGPGVYLFASTWLVGGLVAISIGFIRAKTCQDDLGFNGVALPPLLWGFGYLWSWFVWLLSNGEYGRPGAYIGALLHFTITIMVVFLSHHLPDHPEGPCARRRREGVIK